MKDKIDEAAENLIKLIELLRQAQKDQEKMIEQEKKDNAIKMGDILY